jgi:cytoskeleton protein RodZ
MSDFGTGLRAARERRGIPLRQIADRTKISMPALEALERGDASKLPSGIFGRSFVRSYAAEVGLDPEATLEEFLDRFSDSRFAMMPTTPAEPVITPAPPLAGIALKLVLAVLVAMGIILYFTLFKADPSLDLRPDSARRTTGRVSMVPVQKPSRFAVI